MKLALKKDEANTESKTLMLRAFASREIQLREKGMTKEADVIGRHILTIRPDARALSRERFR